MDLSLEKRAFLARLAYEPDPDIITEQLCIMFRIDPVDIHYIYVERTDTEGFMCRVGDDLLVFYSGTESLTDLGQDAFFIPARYREGWIHSGFKQIMKLIWEPTLVGLENLFYGDRPARVHAGGHSLGAPITMGACETLAHACPDVHRTITTFGCPNGWSLGAREGFNSRHPDCVNYINHGDYVTWLLGITTGRPGRDVVLPGRWGHMMDKYISNVKKLIAQERIAQTVSEK